MLAIELALVRGFLSVAQLGTGLPRPVREFQLEKPADRRPGQRTPKITVSTAALTIPRATDQNHAKPRRYRTTPRSRYRRPRRRP